MSKFDEMKLPELRNELKKRKARVSGRKQELIDRLQAYERNHNFSSVPDTVEEAFHMDLPDGALYKDVTGNTVLPPVTNETAGLYLHLFGTSLDTNCKQLYNDRFLRFVRMAKKDGATQVYIKSECRAQMYTSRIYDIDILLDEYGNVLSAQCECAAGAGPQAHCKHIRTLMLALIDHHQGRCMKLELACTEQVQTFHRPRRLHRGSPVRACNLNVGNTAPDSVIFNPIPEHFREDKAVIQARVSNATINLAATYGVKVPLLQICKPANIYGVDTDHDYLRLSSADQLLHDEKVMQISQSEITEIEMATRDQANSSRWYEERQKRLTASNFGRLCKLTSRTDATNLAREMMTKKFVTSKSLAHGKRYEPVALRKYSEVFGRAVKQSGLVVDSERPYIACSPDGYVGDDLLVEVKCPYVAKDRQISPVSVPYMEETGGKLQLKEGHDYMYQIQGQMHITGRSKCDLVIFTLVDMAIVTIQYNPKFVEEMLAKLDSFYNGHYRVELLNKLLYRNSHHLYTNE